MPSLHASIIEILIAKIKITEKCTHAVAAETTTAAAAAATATAAVAFSFIFLFLSPAAS